MLQPIGSMPKGFFWRKPVKLNLGCGNDYREGWINFDMWAEHVDMRADARAPLVFTDGELEEIYASGVLEQIGPNEFFRDLMNECHRVLKAGGRLTAIVPNAAYPIAFRDPFDCRRFTEETWQYLNAESRFWKNYGSIYGFAPWKIVSIETNLNGIMTVVLEK